MTDTNEQLEDLFSNMSFGSKKKKRKKKKRKPSGSLPSQVAQNAARQGSEAGRQCVLDVANGMGIGAAVSSPGGPVPAIAGAAVGGVLAASNSEACAAAIAGPQ